MRTLAAILKQKLKNADKVAVLGIGSELRGDDVAGVLAARQIEKICKRKATHPQVRVFIGATAPENLSGEIKKFQPTHLIIIDSADIGARPGKIAVINPEDLGGVSFCTHSLPLKVMTDYLLQSLDCRIIIIGIQPGNLAVSANPSQRTIQAVKRLSATITKLLLNKT